MRPIILSLLFIAFIAAPVKSNAQSFGNFDGDVLFYFLSKASGSAEVKELKANYNCIMVNETRYLSSDGIELILQKNILSEINLYSKSAAYGAFTGKLPRKLRFGMTAGEVKQLLGKPLVSYNSGYSEFEYNNTIITCWFEKGRLSQVGLAAKS